MFLLAFNLSARNHMLKLGLEIQTGYAAMARNYDIRTPADRFPLTLPKATGRDDEIGTPVGEWDRHDGELLYYI